VLKICHVAMPVLVLRDSGNIILLSIRVTYYTCRKQTACIINLAVASSQESVDRSYVALLQSHIFIIFAHLDCNVQGKVPRRVLSELVSYSVWFRKYTHVCSTVQSASFPRVQIMVG
jgi:hypothetical protein